MADGTSGAMVDDAVTSKEYSGGMSRGELSVGSPHAAASAAVATTAPAEATARPSQRGGGRRSVAFTRAPPGAR